MLLFKDKNNDAELFTDSYKVKLIDEVIYEVEGKTVVERFDGQVDIGANPSQEEQPEEEVQDVGKRGPDFVLASRLQELSSPYSKKDFQKYLKTVYLKTVPFPEDKKDEYQKNLIKYFKDNVWPKFDDFQQFIGEGLNVEDHTPMICLLNYREDTDYPYMICIKHGLVEEKQ